MGDDVTSAERRLLRRVGAATALTGLLAAAGCDKLPWSPKADRLQTPAASSPAAPSVTPTRPLVASEDTLATVNGVPISRYDLEIPLQDLKRLAESQRQPWPPVNREQLQQILDGLINDELMSQEAVARGLDRNLETQRRWEIDRRAFFAKAWLRWNQERLEVASDEIEQYYRQYQQGFRVPERRRLRQLTVESEDQAKQALTRLLAQGESFASLAQQISIGQAAPQGGLLSGWVVKAGEKTIAEFHERAGKPQGTADAEALHALDPALEAAAFAIDRVDGLSNYVKGSDNRFHVFQLVERQPERQRPLEQAWDEIKFFLLRQKIQEAFDQLNGNAKVERFPERLESVSP